MFFQFNSGWSSKIARLDQERAPAVAHIFYKSKFWFVEKYFPVELRDKKEVEFLAFTQRNTQRNMSVDDYAVKFEELSRYYPPYQIAVSDRSKCVKFKNGLRPELKQDIAIVELYGISFSVDNCAFFVTQTD